MALPHRGSITGALVAEAVYGSHSGTAMAEEEITYRDAWFLGRHNKVCTRRTRSWANHEFCAAREAPDVDGKQLMESIGKQINFERIEGTFGGDWIEEGTTQPCSRRCRIGDVQMTRKGATCVMR